MKEKIDFVVTWVDGNDELWIREKNEYLKIKNKKTIDIEKNRFRDWNIMKYWFRSVEKYAPWIHKIHFVTWGHLPDFLNVDCSKINIVNHKEFIPQKYLPTFNSCSIELNLHRIENLTEQFVYFNDDMFLCDFVKKEDFFVNGLPCEEGVETTLTSPGDDAIYFHNILNSVDVINKNFSKRDSFKRYLGKWINYRYGIENIRTIALLPWKYYSNFKNSHLPAAYLKNTFDTVWSKEYVRMDMSCHNRFRSKDDINQYVFRYWQLASGNFYPRKCLGKAFWNIDESLDEIEEAVLKKKYKAICLNDSVKDTRFDFCKNKLINIFEQAFPDKSQYEI